MITRYLAALILLWVSLPFQIAEAIPFANTPDDSVSYLLERVVVYGERFRPPSSLVEIDAGAIRALSAATVADVLRSSLGMIVTSGAKSETEARVRGFGAASVLVLVDGRPINPGYYGKVDLSMMSLDNVARITVLKGPGDVAYGANAMGGVINILLKNGTDSPEGGFSAEFGDNLYRRMSIYHGRKLNQYSYWISAYEQHSSGFTLSSDFDATSIEDGNLREHSGFHKVGVDGKLGYEPSPRFLASLSYGYHWARKDIPSTIYTWDGPSYREFPDWRRLHLSASSLWKPKQHLAIKTTVFSDGYSDRLVDYQSPARTEESVVYDSQLRNWTHGFALDVTEKFRAAHTLSSNIQFKSDEARKQPDRDQDWLVWRTYTGSLSLQWGWEISSTTNLSVGVGYQRLSPQDAERHSSFVSPMLALHHLLPLALQLRASYARAPRFPTIHELYGGTSGNENLKPQFADKYEVGLEKWFTANQGRDYLKCEVAAFYNDLSDMIYREARSYRYQNIGSANLYGWEIGAQYSTDGRYSLTVSFARLQSSESAFEVMASNPRSTFHSLFSAVLWNRIETCYEFRLVGSRTTRLQEVQLANYTLHDAKATYRLTKAVEVRLEVNNLTDQDYQEELGYPGPGRQVVVGVSTQIGR